MKNYLIGRKQTISNACTNMPICSFCTEYSTYNVSPLIYKCYKAYILAIRAVNREGGILSRAILVIKTEIIEIFQQL